MHTPALRSFIRFARGLAAVLVGALLLDACQSSSASAPTVSAPIETSAGDAVNNVGVGPSELAPIVIDEPSPGAAIVSPLRLRGRLAAVPPQGGLVYRILDAENILLQSGTVATSGEVGNGGSFDVEAVYTSPVSGPGFLQVVQRNDLAGPAVAVSSLVVSLSPNVTTPPTAAGLVATGTPNPIVPTGQIIVPATPTAIPATPTSLPPTQLQGQVITITSPAPGTQVGSPLTVTGNANQFPFGGSLDYRVVNSANQQLGAGVFAVSGVPGQPSSFVAGLQFNLPAGGGLVRVDIYDQDNSGRVAALVSIDLVVAPPQPTAGPQQIAINSPPPNTTVGSPVVITGSTTRFPAQGNLKYRLLDQFGNQLSAGAFLVNGGLGQPGNFNTSLSFNLPQGGGPVRLELVDRDATNGQVFATTSLTMNVAPPATVVPQQRITITSPAPNTQVGSPMTITGNTVNVPTGGNLGYRVTDANGQQIGVGAFPVSAASGQSAFTAQVVFNLPPNGGVIQVDVFDRDNNSGAVLASTSVRLIVAPPPPPTTAPYPQPRR